MTLGNYIRAGLVGLALMAGCREGKAPQRSRYNLDCIQTSDSRTFCARFNESGKVKSFNWAPFGVRGGCFYTAGNESECERSGERPYQMSPALEQAANDLFRGQNELLFGIDKVIYDAQARK